jgi:hypothetical protein
MLSKKLVFGLFLTGSLIAGEGVWLFDHFPKETVQKKYGFVITSEFLDHLERVRSF